ncbi:MAG: DUF2155 domain-containing protein [Geobacter sp.]|nr:MAG: DUF2155 domain-containing protein [Geobacter sp.]
MKQLSKILALLVIATVAVGGCKKKEEKAPAEGMPPHGMMEQKAEPVVVIPESVKGEWKAVKIAVADKSSGKITEYDVEIGTTFPVPNSDLVITVKNFLPDFTMDGNVRTSKSDKPKNPAAQVLITEKGKEIYKNWLFALLKSPHAFQHPKYDITLVGYIPAGK